ncbi:hypothetical protein AU210_016317 [Fusarium oxysporum f. sp. radicis-cucumerinum]|uniref:MalT-like TPR region domain-containing protein n=1 Tax=Fusarium oxysporum f. sp. radicis-cucumerinum TaxID=327505 RepID=A0A2H3FNU8_FUSOX|nr:hypothetical protein AU210_016317 [Fusarium oxysporum f. sp. radicis-cucumerinum]
MERTSDQIPSQGTSHDNKPPAKAAASPNHSFDKALEGGRKLKWLASDAPGFLYPTILSDMHDVAVLYGIKRQPQAAKGFLIAILEEMEEDHPDISKVQAQLALVCYELRHYKEATELVKHDEGRTFLEILSQDAASLDRMRDLVSALCRDGLYCESIAVAEQVLQVKRKMFGSSHHATIAAMCILGRTYCESGDTEKALGLVAESVSTSEGSLGSEHEITLICRYNLALVHSKQGELHLAELGCASIVDLLEDALGPTHGTCIECRCLLLAVREARS